MNKRIVYTRPDAGVSVIIPSGDIPIEDVLAKDVPADAVNARVVDVSEIPSDRTFRDAWEDDGKRVSPNLVKAQKIHMDRIRVVRNEELKKLDIPQMTAISKGDTAEVAKIESKKQALRDLPVTFDLKKAKTADELKALWPAELPKS